MNNEIKEIINDLRKTADNSIFVVCSSQEELDKIPKYTANFLSVNDRQAKILLDYITNLQEENKELNDDNIWWNNRFKAVQRNYKDYKSRNKKAIEFIEKELTFYITIGGTGERKLIGYNKAFDELLKILKGSEK